MEENDFSASGSRNYVEFRRPSDESEAAFLPCVLPVFVSILTDT